MKATKIVSLVGGVAVGLSAALTANSCTPVDDSEEARVFADQSTGIPDEVADEIEPLNKRLESDALSEAGLRVKGEEKDAETFATQSTGIPEEVAEEVDAISKRLMRDSLSEAGLRVKGITEEETVSANHSTGVALSQQPLSKGTWSYKNGKPESVTFDYGTELTAKDIDRLSGIGSITRISMGYAGIDSEYVTIEGELLKLGQLRNLQEVHLCKDGINDDDLRFVALLPKIHTLEFNADNGHDDAPVCTDGCADHLSAAKTLRKLVIQDGQFTDKFVATITKELSGLEELWLNSPDLTDESLRLLADRCKKLKTLRIASEHFTAEGLAHLDRLKYLKERSVSSPALGKNVVNSQ